MLIYLTEVMVSEPAMAFIIEQADCFILPFNASVQQRQEMFWRRD